MKKQNYLIFWHLTFQEKRGYHLIAIAIWGATNKKCFLRQTKEKQRSQTSVVNFQEISKQNMISGRNGPAILVI